MPRSAVIVTVPEAEPVVRDWRLRHTDDEPLGVPAHVTVLFPFLPAEQLAEAEPRLREIVAAAPAFGLAFSRTARFAGVLYLEPDPAEPLAALTEAIVAEWPDYPPYEGAHETVIPHLTVAESDEVELLDRIATDVEAKLPVRTHVRAATVIVENEDGRWSERDRLPLGDAA